MNNNYENELPINDNSYYYNENSLDLIDHLGSIETNNNEEEDVFLYYCIKNRFFMLKKYVILQKNIKKNILIKYQM